MSKPPPSQKHNNTTKKSPSRTAKLSLKPVRTKAAAAKMVPKLPKPKEPKDAQLALTIRLPQTYRDRIDLLAEQAGISVNALFQQLFDRYGTKVDLGPRLDGVEERLGQLEAIMKTVAVVDDQTETIHGRGMRLIEKITLLLDGKPLQAPGLYDANDPAELAFTYVAAYLTYTNDKSVEGGPSVASRDALDAAWEALHSRLRGLGPLKLERQERGASFDVVLTRILEVSTRAVLAHVVPFDAVHKKPVWDEFYAATATISEIVKAAPDVGDALVRLVSRVGQLHAIELPEANQASLLAYHILRECDLREGRLRADEVGSPPSQGFIDDVQKALVAVRALRPDKASGVLGIENDLQLKQACANVGIDLECGACASIFFTGAAPGLPHECARATTATSAFALPPQVGDTFRDLYISRLDSPTDPVHGFSALVTLRSDAEGATHEVSAFGATFEETHKAIFEELAKDSTKDPLFGDLASKKD